MCTSKIIIGGSKGDSLVSSVISWFQFGNEHSHVFYCVPDTNLENPEVIEAWHEPLLKGGGVRRGTFYSSENSVFDLYYIECTEQQAKDFHKFMEDRVGKHSYDYLGILGFAFRSKKLQRNNAYFCSEIIFEGLQSVGINLLNYTEPQRVSPALLLRSPIIKELPKKEC